MVGSEKDAVLVDAFYSTLSDLESLSETRRYLLEEKKETHLLVLYDVIGCTISSLAQYPFTVSGLLLPHELNEITFRLADLTKSLRIETSEHGGQQRGNLKSGLRTDVEEEDGQKQYIASLKGLDELLAKVYGEWSRRLFGNENFKGGKETLAGCVMDWSEQRGRIHEDCGTALWRLDDLMLMALEMVKREVNRRSGL